MIFFFLRMGRSFLDLPIFIAKTIKIYILSCKTSNRRGNHTKFGIFLAKKIVWI